RLAYRAIAPASLDSSEPRFFLKVGVARPLSRRTVTTARCPALIVPSVDGFGVILRFACALKHAENIIAACDPRHLSAMRVRAKTPGWRADQALRPCQTSKDRRIMATRCEQHKTMPDRVVKAQAPPDMKQRAKRVEDAANREQP